MTRRRPSILLIARDHEATHALLALLGQRELDATWAPDATRARAALEAARPDAVIAEWDADPAGLAQVLERARAAQPELAAVLIAAGEAGESALAAFPTGAAERVAPPFAGPPVLAALERAHARLALLERVRELESRLDRRFGLDSLVGGSRAMQRIVEQIRQIAATRASVLIEGERGTGKGLVAQTIHHRSASAGAPFEQVDCAALPDSALEGELFGAVAPPRRGRLELAEGGTVFLDEIAAAPPAVQVKLLRLLQDRTLERPGGQEALKSDVRLIAATERDLAAEVRAGTFREDLLERLGSVRIALPPLRERIEDVPLLVEAFIREVNRERGRKVTGVTRGVLDRLMRQRWPGNVHELRATIEAMVVSATGRRALGLSDLPEPLRGSGGTAEPLELEPGTTVDELERQLIEATLRHTGQDKARAAALLGIGLRTLYRKLRQYER